MPHTSDFFMLHNMQYRPAVSKDLSNLINIALLAHKGDSNKVNVVLDTPVLNVVDILCNKGWPKKPEGQ
jgi:hypothetical protein